MSNEKALRAALKEIVAAYEQQFMSFSFPDAIAYARSALAAPETAPEQATLSDERIEEIYNKIYQPWAGTFRKPDRPRPLVFAFARALLSAAPLPQQREDTAPLGRIRMMVCPICGNKRCPHANDPANACTSSNEPGQPGSAYPAKEGKTT